MKTVSIAAFVKRHYPAFQSMDRDKLMGFLQWFVDRGALACAVQRGRIVAIGMVRPVASEAEAEQPYVWNPWGACLFCELAVSIHRRGMEAVWGEMRARFPQRRFLFKRRNKGLMSIREYDADRMTALLQKGCL
jgi:hypothetical protein